MFSFAIVEDSVTDLENAKSCINRLMQENSLSYLLDCYSSSEDFFKSQKKYDLLILDIMLDDKTGMDIANIIRDSGNDKTIIVFITSLANYAIKGYDVGAATYVLKPYTYEEFSLKFTKVISALKAKMNNTLLLNAKDGDVVVSIDDINYIEVYGHYLTYHLGNVKYTVRETLSLVEKKLANQKFVRISKCYLVNIKNIEKVIDDYVYLKKEQEPIKISRSLKKSFKEAIIKSYVN